MSFVALSVVPVLGAVEPPLPVSPVAVPVSVPVLPDVVLSELEELSDDVLSDELLSLLLESLLLFAEAAAVGA